MRTFPPKEVARAAHLSKDLKYRYALSRCWDERKAAIIIGLNPSTADAHEDDPTIRRCMRFAWDWDCGALLMLNLFALRATDPRFLKSVHDPVGPGNDRIIRDCLSGDGVVVCAWGVCTPASYRPREMWELIQSAGVQRDHIYCLGTTKEGHPRHPLYLRASERPRPWKPPWHTEKIAAKPC